MQKLVIGVFDSYSTAHKVVQDLEIAGFSGESVEVVSGAHQDASGTGIEGSGAEEKIETFAEKIAKFFHSLTDHQHDTADDPYAEDRQFYANQVRQGRALVIVRAQSDRSANRAADVLNLYGGHGLDGKDSKPVSQPDEPRRAAATTSHSSSASIGSPGAGTTGDDPTDLEGRGKELRKAAPHS